MKELNWLFTLLGAIGTISGGGLGAKVPTNILLWVPSWTTQYGACKMSHGVPKPDWAHHSHRRVSQGPSRPPKTHHWSHHTMWHHAHNTNDVTHVPGTHLLRCKLLFPVRKACFLRKYAGYLDKIASHLLGSSDGWAGAFWLLFAPWSLECNSKHTYLLSSKCY